MMMQGKSESVRIEGFVSILFIGLSTLIFLLLLPIDIIGFVHAGPGGGLEKNVSADFELESSGDFVFRDDGEVHDTVL